MKSNWTGQILLRNCLLKQLLKRRKKIEGTERRGRRGTQLPDDLKETRGYRKLKEQELARTVRRTDFERGNGPVEGGSRVWNGV